MSIIQKFLDEVRTLTLIDIGCSGALSSKWKPIEKYLHVIGFDVNEEECKRMSSLPHPFASVEYLPYALAGEEGKTIMFKTKDPYCYSLLKPKTTWLRRFSFGDLFELIGTEEVMTKKLDMIPELSHIDIDIIKVDSQGLELPILSNAAKALERSFYVETETGFSENYIGETTYAQIDEFMRCNNFLLFDINTNHRVSRKNIFKDNVQNEQIIYCEATWMKDYVALRERNKFDKTHFDRNKALKSLILCSLQGCISFGYELAKLYNELGLITSSELDQLELEGNWKIGYRNPVKVLVESILNYSLRLLPKRWRSYLKVQVEIAENQRHLFKR